MASLQDIILTCVSTIHAIINQVQVNEKLRLKMLIDNVKFMLHTSKKLMDKKTYQDLENELKKAEDILLEFDNFTDDDINGVRTYIELQSKVQKKMKEREKYITDKCLEIMSKILENCEGLMWQ